MIQYRRFRDSDAPGLATWLQPLMGADDVCTAPGLVHQLRSQPRRGRSVWVVAVTGGRPVGLGRDEAHWWGTKQGVRRVWVGVRHDHRRQGIGRRLWDLVADHAQAAGAAAMKSWTVADEGGGRRFLEARGLACEGRELQSWVDPADLPTADLRRRQEDADRRGFEVRRLADLLPDLEAPLRRLYLKHDPDAAQSSRAVTAAMFRRFFLDSPLLDREVSTVVLEGGRPVSLCWLKGDRAAGRYGVEFTGTLLDRRGMGLATLAKLSALDLAAKAGIRWVGTANSPDNAPMLAINRALASTPLPDLEEYQLDLG